MRFRALESRNAWNPGRLAPGSQVRPRWKPGSTWAPWSGAAPHRLPGPPSRRENSTLATPPGAQCSDKVLRVPARFETCVLPRDVAVHLGAGGKVQWQDKMRRGFGPGSPEPEPTRGRHFGPGLGRRSFAGQFEVGQGQSLHDRFIVADTLFQVVMVATPGPPGCNGPSGERPASAAAFDPQASDRTEGAHVSSCASIRLPVRPAGASTARRRSPLRRPCNAA